MLIKLVRFFFNLLALIERERVLLAFLIAVESVLKLSVFSFLALHRCLLQAWVEASIMN